MDDRIQSIIDSFRTDPAGTAALLAALFTIGLIARRLTHAGPRHKRLHPSGLNSDPDKAPSILSTDEETR